MGTTIKILSNPIVKDGVQGLILVKNSNKILNQKVILVQDFDDRGRGDGIRLLGLPGGGIEFGEKPEKSLQRELNEEINLFIKINSFQRFGCYTKLRPNGVTNNNYLFFARVLSFKKRETNDPKEVSCIKVLSLGKIIEKARMELVHEGSIRLIFNFLNGIKTGSLNEPVTFNGFTF